MLIEVDVIGEMKFTIYCKGEKDAEAFASRFANVVKRAVDFKVIESDLMRLKELLTDFRIEFTEERREKRVVLKRGEPQEATAWTTVTIEKGIGFSELRGNFYFDANMKFIVHSLYEN